MKIPPPGGRPSAPPPPIPEVVRKRRLLLYRLFLSGIALVIAGAAIHALIPSTHGRNPEADLGISIPGLEREEGDDILATAPDGAFTPVEFSELGRWTPRDSIEGTDFPDPPEDIAALDGLPVVIEGYMVPLDDGETTRDFVLIATMGYCYFCDPPVHQRVVYCRTSNPNGTEPLVNTPVRAFGVFSVGRFEERGGLHSIYRMRVTRVVSLLP